MPENKKQLVLDSIMNKTVARTPWVPFVGCHAGALIGVDAETYGKNADCIVKGVLNAIEEYKPDGIPVAFDLQLEAEILRCELKFAKDNPPSVTSHPLAEGLKLKDLYYNVPDDSRLAEVLRATKEISAKAGNDVALYGLVTGPFTLALHLMGTDIFYDIADEPDYVKEVLAFCEQVCIKTAGLYLDSGVDIIALVDPMTSQISPDHFEEFVTPYAKRIFEYVRNRGKLSSFFVCGHARRNVEKMCECGPDNISIDENIPLDYVKAVGEKYGVSIGGNIKLTLTLLFGSPTDAIRDAENCMSIGGNKGFILAPGCDVPYATPKENIKAISSLIHGEVTQFLSSGNALDGIDYELPDYANEKQVIIDVITLDSASCAPCQYTMEAVYAACDGFGDAVKVIEHKIKEKESVVCMLKIGAAYIPTIVIDGKIKYESIIPEVPVLREDIVQAVAVKKNHAI